MKKFMFASLGLLSSATAFAEGEGTVTMDTSSAVSMVESATTGLTGLLTTVVPYITTLFLAGLAIWAAFVIFRLVKRAFSRAA